MVRIAKAMLAGISKIGFPVIVNQRAGKIRQYSHQALLKLFLLDMDFQDLKN